MKIRIRKIIGLALLLSAFLALTGANWADSTEQDSVPAPVRKPSHDLRRSPAAESQVPAQARSAAARTRADWAHAAWLARAGDAPLVSSAAPLERAYGGHLPVTASRAPSGRAADDSLPPAPRAASSSSGPAYPDLSDNPFVPTAPLADATPAPDAPMSTSAPQPDASWELHYDTSDAANHIEGYLWIYGGMDAGTMNVSTSAAGEENQSGYQIRPKLLASYYITKDWVVDGGIGWARFAVDTGSENATVLTRAGFAEVSPKWRPSDRWALGPVADLYYGTDLSLAESYQASGVALFGGAQAQFEIPVASSWRMRLGATFLTSIGVAQRDGYTALFGLELGLPVAKLK